MNKLILCSLLIGLVSCSVKNVREDSDFSISESVVTEVSTPSSAAAPAASAPVKVSEPVRSSTPPPNSHYTALNEAITAQNDEKIYQASTQIIAQSPSDARALNALAMYHYKKGRFDLCRYLLGKAIAANPKTAELYSNLGIVQLAQNERREAVKSFRKSLEVNNNQVVAASNLGSIYVKEKDFAKANIVLDMAYKRGVRDVRVQNDYAITLTATKNFNKAQEIYKSILKEDSNNKDALYNYATLLIEHLNKNQEGLDIINRLKFVGGPSETRNQIITLENKAKAGLK